MSKIQLGDLATWLAAIGTVAAFVLAFGQLEAERKQKRRHTLELQARQVSAWVAREGAQTATNRSTWIEVLNNSSEPIYEVIATIVRFPHVPREDGPKDGLGVPMEFRGFLSVVPPGRSFVSVNGGYRGMSFQPAVEIAFRDKNGKSWLRGHSGGCFELPVTPTKHYDLSPPLSWELPTPELPANAGPNPS